MKTTRREHAGFACLMALGLVACQPGPADDDPTSATEGSTTAVVETSADSSTESADTTGGSSMDDTDPTETETEAEPGCGDGVVDGVEECDGDELLGATCESLGYTVGTLACDSACAYDTSACSIPPSLPVLTLGFSAVKQFDFSWAALADADYYQLEESAAPGEPFVQLGGDIVGESISHTMPLHFRYQASYRLRACNPAGCTGSAEVGVVSSLADAVGYVKASNTGMEDQFGLSSIALSGDGNTLAIGASGEDSNATGIDGDQANDSASNSGAVYVFVRDAMGTWSQQAYIKASNAEVVDHFGGSVALSEDGNTLAVGAYGERSNATGIDGDQTNNALIFAGAVYVLVRDGMGEWSQQAYVKASNPDNNDVFGFGVALSEDGNTLAASAHFEQSNATGIDGDQANDSADEAGAVYVFVRDGLGTWSQQAYVKASNTDANDEFGSSMALSGDGNTLAVASVREASTATGIDGDQADDSSLDVGAVYVFARDGLGQWSQQAYVKASNAALFDYFGTSVALSGNGDILAVGASGESSNATGIDGDQTNDATNAAGAVYVFERDGLGTWSQQAYVKASNTGIGDIFGTSVALSDDGNILAVGANGERSSAAGIDGDQTNNALTNAGGVYVFVRDGMGTWSQRTYVKASNPGADDRFGYTVALSGDGNTLAVSAFEEDGNATGIDGDQANDAALGSGAVYLY